MADSFIDFTNAYDPPPVDSSIVDAFQPKNLEAETRERLDELWLDERRFLSDLVTEERTGGWVQRFVAGVDQPAAWLADLWGGIVVEEPPLADREIPAEGTE